MTIDRVYLNNLFFLFQYGGFFDDEYGYFGELHHALGDRLKEETLDVGGGATSGRCTPLTLDRCVDPRAARPLPRVGGASRTTTRRAQRWLLLTDLGRGRQAGRRASSWSGSRRSATWRRSRARRSRSLSDQNQTIGRGADRRLGPLGACATPRPLGEEAAPYMVTIEKGDDFSFLLLDTMRIDTTGLDVGGAEPPGDGLHRLPLRRARHLPAGRDGSRGWRWCATAASSPPPAMPALLRHRDPQGRERGDPAADDRRPRAWRRSGSTCRPTR